MSIAPSYGRETSSAVYSGIMEGIMELDIRLRMTKEAYAGEYQTIVELGQCGGGTGLLAGRGRE